MKKDEIIKALLKKKVITEQVRYDVSTSISYYPEAVKKELKRLNITEAQFRECLGEYNQKRKIFGFYKLSTLWDDTKFKINNQIVK